MVVFFSLCEMSFLTLEKKSNYRKKQINFSVTKMFAKFSDAENKVLPKFTELMKYKYRPFKK